MGMSSAVEGDTAVIGAPGADGERRRGVRVHPGGRRLGPERQAHRFDRSAGRPAGRLGGDRRRHDRGRRTGRRHRGRWRSGLGVHVRAFRAGGPQRDREADRERRRRGRPAGLVGGDRRRHDRGRRPRGRRSAARTTGARPTPSRAPVRPPAPRPPSCGPPTATRTTAWAPRWPSRATRSWPAPPSDDVGPNNDQGSAYTFTSTGAPSRTHTARLTAGDGAAVDQLRLLGRDRCGHDRRGGRRPTTSAPAPLGARRSPSRAPAPPSATRPPS